MGLNFCNLSPYGLNLYNSLHFSLHLYISPSTALTTAIIVCHTKLVVLFPMHFFAAKISMSFGLRVFHFSAWICTLSRATALKTECFPLLWQRLWALVGHGHSLTIRDVQCIHQIYMYMLPIMVILLRIMGVYTGLAWITKRRNGYYSRPLSFCVLVILSIFSNLYYLIRLRKWKKQKI